MIAPLRRRHRTAFAVIAFAAPALFVAALLVRRPVPPTDAAALAGLGPGTELAPLVGAQTLWPDEAFGITWTIHARPGGPILDLAPLGAPLLPDLLVYLTDAEALGRAGSQGLIEFADGAEALPEDAVLIGAFDGVRPARFELPPPLAADRDQPAIVLYSLAHATLAAGVWLEDVGVENTAKKNSAEENTAEDDAAEEN